MASVQDSLRQLRVDAARLSRKTGIAPARVQALEGGADPTPTELRLIAAYVKLPADALYRVDQITGHSDIRYRGAGQHVEPIVAEARIREIGRFLTRCHLVPALSVPLRVTATLDDRVSIENAALLVREHICTADKLLDPLCDLADRVDQSGLASVIVLSDLSVEGAGSVVDGRGLIVVADRTFKPRMLFTCAHELAHLVLGHITPDRWLIDEDTIETFNDERADERLCDVLASAILLPAEGVARFLKVVRTQIEARHDAISDTEILFLARYFGTSFLAAAMRLELLDLLPRGSGFVLEAAIKERHTSAETYAEALGLPPRTPIEMRVLSPKLRECITSALADGAVSIGRTAETLGLSAIEISDALA